MKRMKRLPPPAPPPDNCAFNAPDSIGVRAALDNLLHFHLMHTDKPFSAWCKPVTEAAGRKVSEAEVLIISDPKLLERVRKVMEVPTAETGATIH